MHISWVVLQMRKSSPNEKTTWWLFSWSLRIDNAHTCDSTLLPHRQPVRELCMSWLFTLLPASLTWLLKVLCQNLELAETFQGKKYLFSWHGPALKLSLLQTPMFQFVWPHCALGTQTFIISPLFSQGTYWVRCTQEPSHPHALSSPLVMPVYLGEGHSSGLSSGKPLQLTLHLF